MTLATVVCLLALFGLGSCFALLGSVSVKLMPRLNIDSAKFGTLVSGLMSAAVVSSLVLGVVLDAIGFKTVAILGFVIVTVVILLLARGKTYSSVLLASALLGIGAMALNTAGNTMAPQVLDFLDPAAASNLGNVFFGLGLFFTPLITSKLFQRTTYENSVSALAVLMVVGAILAVIATDYPQAQGGDFTIGGAFALLANPTVLTAAFLLFCYMSLETSFSNWLMPFGKEVLTAGGGNAAGVRDVDATAAKLLTTFAIAMMIGRLAAGILPGMLGIDLAEVGGYLIAIVALASAGVVFSMTTTRNFGQAQLMAFLGGFFFAPIFPSTVGVTFDKINNPAINGSVFGIIFAVGLFGGMIVPAAIGNMAKGSTIQRSLRILIIACLVLAALAVALQFVGGEQ